MNAPVNAFVAARDTLIRHRADYASAVQQFHSPRMEHFNWALDYFDDLARGNDTTGLIIAGDDGEHRATFAELSRRSNQVANHLRQLGVKRGEAIMLMMGNEIPLWETMLAAIKLGTPFIPCSVLLTQVDLEERMARSGARHVVTHVNYAERFGAAQGIRVCSGTDTPPAGWVGHSAAYDAPESFTPDAPTAADEPMIFYFTSGTTSKPKLVVHTHTSYPVGHLSTMYWIGITPASVHLNLSSPGWAKHAWSSFFAPWNAGATLVATDMARFDAATLLGCLARYNVNSFCAPPTVWRLLIQDANLATWREKLQLTELVSAGEPLNPEVIDRIRTAWGLTIRDGYGQTETTATMANTPGQALKEGSMGRPLPGFAVELLDANGKPAEEGEVCLALSPQRPVGLMRGYRGNAEKTAEVMRDGYYHTGDVAARDADGYFTYVGRADDVFKASDYRISPFELESVMITHPAITEAAVVPSPDPVRTSVPKAFVTVAAGVEVTEIFAREVFAFTRKALAPYKRVRRIQFVRELPKTVSGKIRRVQLRAEEAQRRAADQRGEGEFLEADFPDLKQEEK